MASTSVLVELVCGELGIDASKPMVERVKAAAQLVGIQFVSVRATTEALAAQLLPVTREESSDDDVVLTHVETPRSKAAASLAEAERTGAVVTIDDSEPRRPPAWYVRAKHLSARKLVVSLIESRLRTLARGGVCVVRNARNFPRAARLIEFRLLCDAASLSAYRDAKTLAARMRTELRRAACSITHRAGRRTGSRNDRSAGRRTLLICYIPHGPLTPSHVVVVGSDVLRLGRGDADALSDRATRSQVHRPGLFSFELAFCSPVPPAAVRSEIAKSRAAR